MPLTPEQLRERLVGELRSMPPGLSRVASDTLYSTIAQRRHTYPLGGYVVLHDIIVDVSPFWLEPSADPISPSIRDHTAPEIQEWVNWVDGQLYETVVEASRAVAPNIDDDYESDIVSSTASGPSSRSVATQTDWTLLQ